MGRRFIAERIENIPLRRWTGLWPRAGAGRYWKRQLSKSRRRAWKQYRIEGRANTRYESECANKNW